MNSRDEEICAMGFQGQDRYDLNRILRNGPESPSDETLLEEYNRISDFSSAEVARLNSKRFDRGVINVMFGLLAICFSLIVLTNIDNITGMIAEFLPK